MPGRPAGLELGVLGPLARVQIPDIDGLPEQDRRDHREEAQHRAEEEVAPVGHALDERDAEDVEVLSQDADGMEH